MERYIKDINPDDVQLSLWGGDVVLKNIELKLSVLEAEAGLPVVFRRGIIRELRVHVPITSINSKPVVVSIDAAELVIAGHRRRRQTVAKGRADPPSVHAAHPNAPSTESSPPAYIQALLKRVRFP